MKELRPGRLRSITDVIGSFVDDMPEILPEDEMLYVYTSEDQLDGGSTIFIEGAKEAIADRLQDSYFVLFSSIHESMIVPESRFGSSEDALHQLQDMLDSGNASLVKPEEIMATSPFHFDRISGIFEPISAFAARTRGIQLATA